MEASVERVGGSGDIGKDPIMGADAHMHSGDEACVRRYLLGAPPPRVITASTDHHDAAAVAYTSAAHDSLPSSILRFHRPLLPLRLRRLGVLRWATGWRCWCAAREGPVVGRLGDGLP